MDKSLQDWLKKKPVHVVEIGDGKPPFKIDLKAQLAQLKKKVKAK
jgi:hypothetical protein